MVSLLLIGVCGHSALGHSCGVDGGRRIWYSQLATVWRGQPCGDNVLPASLGWLSKSRCWER